MKNILKTFICIAFLSLFLPYSADAEIIDTYVLRGLSRNIVYYDAYPGGNPPCTPGGSDIFLNYGALDNTRHHQCQHHLYNSNPLPHITESTN
ncbi:MAG: hypothetical protein KatS3mg087_0371 [Patescibacteria group bacterium]|nr:MAG: hypothetical protein KatS3mg087_0371 [Patescibacteria group bacterium]